MNIGKAAFASGISSKMIRYYEENGVIPPANRTVSGYRDYSMTDVHMLRFIRRARDLGFSVSEITELLSLWRDRSRSSADVKRIALSRITDLNLKITGLQQMVSTLQTLAEQCSGDERPNCPILADLENPQEEKPDAQEPRRGALDRHLR